MKSISDAEWKVMKSVRDKSPVLASEIVEEPDELQRLLDFKKK